MSYTLHNGDCLDVMTGMADNTIDSIVTDPPYGLTFMGKTWDHGVPGVPYWQEALRVAKPGAFLLAFGGTRTYHRLTCAIEDAGWQIRDCIMWVYGSGFPKSANISKLLDKAAGAEREVIGEIRRWGNAAGSGRGGQYANGYESSVCGAERFDPITAPATEAAQAFDGYGTALKPAYEPIIVAMKPVDGSFANNALTWGLAGLNIDECRVLTEGRPLRGQHGPRPQDGTASSYDMGSRYAVGETTQGRWPANLIHDGSDEVMDLFPASAPAKAAHRGAGINGATFKAPDYASTVRGHNDNGGSAARFFYCAKASQSERNAGLDGRNPHVSVKPLALMQYLCRLVKTPTGGTVLDPFMGSGTTGVACANTGSNFVGIERDAGYFAVAEKRISGATHELQPTLMEAHDDHTYDQ